MRAWREPRMCLTCSAVWDRRCWVDMVYLRSCGFQRFFGRHTAMSHSGLSLYRQATDIIAECAFDGTLEFPRGIPYGQAMPSMES